MFRSSRWFRQTALLATGLLASACAATSAAQQTTTPSSSAGSAAASPSANPNLSQCGKSSRSITDDLGHVTTVQGTPKRIVSIEFSFTDDVSLLGVSPVGLGDDGDPSLLLPQIRSRIGHYTSIGTRESPNLAVIAGLHPDLILADRIGNAKVMDQLRAIAPTLALLSQHASYQQSLDTAVTIGAALDQCAKTQSVLAAHTALMNHYKSEVPAGEKRTYVIGLSSAKTFTVFNDQQYNSQVLDLLGLRPLATDTNTFKAGDAQGITLETLASLNPEIVFYCNVLDAPSGLFDTWKSSPIYQATRAAQTHAVYRVGQPAWSLTRGITGSEVIAAEAVHDLYGK
jgi:ABC-type Fe3+-citrate transport system substrate-binding protein